MQRLSGFLLLALLTLSCRKEASTGQTPPPASTPAPTPVTDTGDGRYDKDLFAAVKTTLNVKYGEAMNIAGGQEALLMDVYEPEGDTAGKRAAVFFVHGGAWTSGSKRQGENLCTYLAKKGYWCASIDYRLGIENPVTEKTRGEAIYRGVQDLKAAVRYARAGAAALRIDTARIFIGGYSAGATNAAHTAYWTAAEVPTDIDAARWGPLEGSGGNAAQSSRVHVLYTIAGSLSDRAWLGAGEPPLVCVHSKTDGTVPYYSGLDGKGLNVFGGAALVERAAQVGLAANLYTYDNIAHGDYLQDTYFPTTAAAVSGFLKTYAQRR